MDVAYVWFGTYADSMKRVRKEVTRSFMVGLVWNVVTLLIDGCGMWKEGCVLRFLPGSNASVNFFKIEIKKNGQK